MLVKGTELAGMSNIRAREDVCLLVIGEVPGRADVEEAPKLLAKASESWLLVLDRPLGKREEGKRAERLKLD